MSTLLHDHLDVLRRRVRRVLWLYGLSWSVAVVFGTVLLAGLLDWLLHLDDPGVRVILALVVLGAGGWVVWRYLISPLRVPISDVDLALQIEARYPWFKDSLSSTVQFLRGDATLGSPQLQRRVVDETLTRASRLRPADFVDTREIRRVVGVAALVCIVVAIVVGLNQAEAATALRRLMFPFAVHPWPKQTVLQLVDADLRPLQVRPDDPLRIARGDTLELFVENVRGKLPESVQLQYRLGKGPAVSEPLRKTQIRDAQGRVRELAPLHITVVQGPMLFRAVGGDDRGMRWYGLHVVPPPVVERLQVTVTPPAYSGRAAERLSPGVGHVQGLVGTRVELQATANKPLLSSFLRIRNQQPELLQLSSDRRSFQASFEIAEAGVYSYWFELKDRDGFTDHNAPRYEIRGVADLPPDIYIEQPATDVHLTADAELPIRTVAKDDLGLKEIRLHFQLGPDDAGQRLPLYSGEERPQQQGVDWVWPLSSLSLQEGAQIVFRTEATDAFDLGPEHVGRSNPRTITIVSPEDKADELAVRTGGLLEDLQRIHGLQERAAQQVRELQVQLDKAKTLRPQDVDLLKRIELDQSQITSRLTESTDGVEARARRILEELESNHLAEPDIAARVGRVGEELRRIAEDHLPAIQRALTGARKGAAGDEFELPEPAEEADGKPDAENASAEEASSTDPEQALAQAEQHQAEVVRSFGAMLEQLEQWQSERDLTRELDQIVAGQSEINDETAEVGRRTLTKPLAELPPQDQADLARLASRQREGAARLEQLVQQLADTAERLQERDPLTSSVLEQAAGELEGQATAGRMQQSAVQLEANQIGQATEGQENVLRQLNAMSDLLRSRPGDDAESLVKRLRKAEEDVETLRKQQDELRAQSQELASSGTEEQREELQQLIKQQEQLQQAASRQERELERLQMESPGAALGRAADRMQEAAGELQNEQGEQAAAAQQEALADLEQAQRELARERRQLEEQLAEEQLEQLSDELTGLVARQQGVIEETQRLDEERRSRGNWSRAQLKSLRDLAQVQAALREEVERMTAQVGSAEVFALVLRGVSRNMQQANDRLNERQTDSVTVGFETSARQRLADLLAALEPSETPEGEPMPETPGEQPTGPPGQGVPPIAELRMMKSLQEELLRRTGELDESRRKNDSLSKEEAREREALSREQLELADLAAALLRRGD